MQQPIHKRSIKLHLKDSSYYFNVSLDLKLEELTNPSQGVIKKISLGVAAFPELV